jgi:hypothetical protein
MVMIIVLMDGMGDVSMGVLAYLETVSDRDDRICVKRSSWTRVAKADRSDRGVDGKVVSQSLH